MRLSRSQIEAALGVPADAIAPDVTGYSIDSRTVQPGDLFFALPGERRDGHEFVSEVLARGAGGAVVSADVPGNRLLRVPNVLTALQRLAGWARQYWGGTLVGVTGSAGKTTTKDVIAAMLETAMPVGRTIGNLNNHIGLPLTILRLPDDVKVAVVEYGMNHAGEIRDLCRIARPDIGVVTNVGYAHIENFDSIEGIAAAKRELIEALPESGVAVLNADDTRVRQFRHRHHTVTFGVSADAGVRACDVQLGADGVRFRVDGVEFESALMGMHGLRNILAGIAVAQVLGVKTVQLTGAVHALQPGKMRGERFVHGGITIYNDCYNSNPDAVRSMLDVLRDTPARRRIAVLGEMLELGRWSEPLHRDVGRYVVECGISVLLGIRGATRHMVDAAMESGMGVNAAYFFHEPEEAGLKLRTLAKPGDAILFKGSRGTRVEKALERFLE